MAFNVSTTTPFIEQFDWPNTHLAIQLATAAFVICIPIVWLYLLRAMTIHPKAPPMAQSTFPLIGAIAYITRTWDFFHDERSRVLARPSAMKNNPYQALSFRLGRLPVVAVMGEKARQWFYAEPKLDFDEGYNILFGAMARPPPEAKAGSEETEEKGNMAGGEFVTRLKLLLSSTWLETGKLNQ